MRIREEMVVVPGGQLWTATSGTGIPLVLCHGGPGAYDYLEPVAQMVDDIAEVHRFDQRGGGRSTRDGPHTVASLVADIERLRIHWGHERWLVGGQSRGAHLALFYALAHPERTDGVVFMNGTGIRWGWGPARRSTRMKRLSEGEQQEVLRLERAVADGDGEAPLERLHELWWLTDFADRTVAARSGRYDAYPRDPEVIVSLERDWQATLDQIERQLALLDAPALVLHGDSDPIGQDGPREVARLLRRSTFVILERVGHLPWLEDPETLRQALRRFLAEHAGPAAIGPGHA